MKRYIVAITVALIMMIPFACKKDYGSLSGNITLTGYAYLADTISNLPPSPLAGQKFYLNTGTDTGSYIFQGITDSIGQFSVRSLNTNSSYILFTRFVKNNIEYSGGIKFEGKDIENNNRVILNIYPVRRNGMALLFTDLSGGNIPNLAFRLYTSRIMALSDSTTYAFASASSSPSGQYTKFDIAAAKYYVVSKLSVGGSNLAIFDSITVSANSIKHGTMVLK